MFCSKCGKEIAEDAQFCQFCGEKVQKEEVKQENQETEPTNDNYKKTSNNTFGYLIVIIFFFVIIGLTNMGGNSNTDTTTKTQKASCPSIADMEDAIRLYKEGKIIYSFTPELNTVKVTPLAEKQFLSDDYRTLGYITACYSGYKKGNNLNWVDIYSAKTDKKIAQFSESYGFKMH